jgi:tRNA(His) guanylyltransferase
MSKPSPLGVRMKGYEQPYRRVLPARTYTLLRLDGNNFSSYTKPLEKPFDHGFAEDMHTAARALCMQATNVAFGYVASDEISVLLTDFATPSTQQWLGGVEAKMLSVSASMVTAAFNAARAKRGDDRLAHFDARVQTLADPAEVVNYFIWRQRDTVKNSVSMAASAHFSHRKLHALTSNERQELLFSEAGVNWNDYPVWARRGSVMTRVHEEDVVTYVDGRTKETVTTPVTRRTWQVLGAPRFTAEPDAWLWKNLPIIGGATQTTDNQTDSQTDTRTDKNADVQEAAS